MVTIPRLCLGVTSCPQTDPATAISLRTLNAERAENLVGRQPMKSGFANAFAHDEFYFAPGDFFVDFHCLNQILWQNTRRYFHRQAGLSNQSSHPVETRRIAEPLLHR